MIWWESAPAWQPPPQTSIIPKRLVCQVRKRPCCFDETNIHRNPVFLRGANLSCLATTCSMYRKLSDLLPALGGHYEARKKNNHNNIERQNVMDSCIKWMRPSSLQDLGYTTSHMELFVPRSLKSFHDETPLAVSVESNVQYGMVSSERGALLLEYLSFSHILKVTVVFVSCYSHEYGQEAATLTSVSTELSPVPPTHGPVTCQLQYSYYNCSI